MKAGRAALAIRLITTINLWFHAQQQIQIPTKTAGGDVTGREGWKGGVYGLNGELSLVGLLSARAGPH